jgi:hypothetical protein
MSSVKFVLSSVKKLSDVVALEVDEPESSCSYNRCLIASIAIRIMSDTRDEEQEQRWRACNRKLALSKY